MHRIRGNTEPLRLRQFCNDWFMAASATTSTLILRPTQVELDDDEIARLREHPDTGTLWREFAAYEHTPGVWRFRKVSG